MHKFPIRVTCPYCGNRERRGVYGPVALFSKIAGTTGYELTASIFSAARMDCHSYCLNCHFVFGVSLYDRQSKRHLNNLIEASGDDMLTDVALNRLRIVTQPRSMTSQIISGIPTELAKSLLEIQEDVRQKRNAAGVMAIARAILDVCLKEQGFKKGGRLDRIQELFEAGKITQGLSDWANKLWKEGSDAVHDLTASNEQAAEHVEWLKLFLKIVYELPEQIENASLKAKPETE